MRDLGVLQPEHPTDPKNAGHLTRIKYWFKLPLADEQYVAAYTQTLDLGSTEMSIIYRNKGSLFEQLKKDDLIAERCRLECSEQLKTASLYSEVKRAPTSNTPFHKGANEAIGGFDLSITVGILGVGYGDWDSTRKHGPTQDPRET